MVQISVWVCFIAMAFIGGCKKTSAPSSTTRDHGTERGESNATDKETEPDMGEASNEGEPENTLQRCQDDQDNDRD